MTTPTGGHSARVEQESGEVRLVVDGAVQSVAVTQDAVPRGYWRALVPERRPVSSLILGLGGGTVVHLLWRRYGSLPVVGVDYDGTALALGRQQFSLASPQLSIIEADAEGYVRRCTSQFGLVVVDLFQGERLPEFLSTGGFLRRVRGLVSPGGTLVWNLHRDRRSAILRRRVGRGLPLERRIFAGLNLVLHFRRRSRQRRVLHPSWPASSRRR